jgi:hypothetical protein
MNKSDLITVTTGRDVAVSRARALNDAQPSVPNSTKVVRLFVLPRDRDIVKPMDKRDFGHTSPGRADVFVVTNPDGSLKPMSWLGDKLVDHDHAHHEHVGTVVVLSNKDREQIEWQCDVPFKVTNITKLTGHTDHFPSTNGPDYPFIMSLRDLQAQSGDKDRPIRSGTTLVNGIEPGPWSQLYKADFKLFIHGEWRDFDPDFYCGTPPPN